MLLVGGIEDGDRVAIGAPSTGGSTREGYDEQSKSKDERTHRALSRLRRGRSKFHAVSLCQTTFGALPGLYRLGSIRGARPVGGLADAMLPFSASS